MKSYIFNKIRLNAFNNINKKANDDIIDTKYHPIFLFFSIIVLYFIYQIIMQPNFMLHGEMWAEMADNYYYNAISPSIYDKLLATDFGYVPLPQRIIALIGSIFHFPAISIPYFYTWSATILTSILVGVFCLKPFRKLVPNDYLRLLTCFIILISVDFQTKTFINFTYFSAFFIAITTALALSDKSSEVPRWVWIIPLLFISKPAVMAALPAMIAVAFVSSTRFRLITFTSLIACALQIIQLFISSHLSALPLKVGNNSFFEKISATMQYVIGFLGSHSMGPDLKETGMPIYLFGTILFFCCVFFIVFNRNSAKPLIFVGLSLLIFNILLNTFALSETWNSDMSMLNGFLINRHIIVGFHGIILIVCGIICCFTHQVRFQFKRPVLSSISLILLSIWFISLGFFTKAVELNKEPSLNVNNSQWINMASALDANISPLCVPVNPWNHVQNWMYSKNCQLLNASPWWNNGSVKVNNYSKFLLSFAIKQPAKNLVSAAIIVKPISLGRSFVEAIMAIELKDGQTIFFVGSRNIDDAGGLLILTGLKPIAIANIKSIFLTFNSSVYVARSANEPVDMPGIAWMGN